MKQSEMFETRINILERCFKKFEKGLRELDGYTFHKDFSIYHKRIFDFLLDIACLKNQLKLEAKSQSINSLKKINILSKRLFKIYKTLNYILKVTGGEKMTKQKYKKIINYIQIRFIFLRDRLNKFSCTPNDSNNQKEVENKSKVMQQN